MLRFQIHWQWYEGSSGAQGPWPQVRRLIWHGLAVRPCNQHRWSKICNQYKQAEYTYTVLEGRSGA